MDLYGCHFEFGGVSSRKYGLIFVNAETERYILLHGESEAKTIFSKKHNRRFLVRDDYSSSPIEFEAEIMREDEKCFDPYTIRGVEKWLFSNSRYRKLYIDAGDDPAGETTELIEGVQKRLYFNCRFKNPEKMEYNGGIVGFKFTVECDSCLAWQDETIKTFELGHSTQTDSTLLNIEIDTDLDDYVYPKVTINTGSSGGDIIIVNNSDDSLRATGFSDVPPLTGIVMKGELNYISNGYYECFSNPNFIRFLDGTNTVSVTGDVRSITFEWQNRRYL